MGNELATWAGVAGAVAVPIAGMLVWLIKDLKRSADESRREFTAHLTRQIELAEKTSSAHVDVLAAQTETLRTIEREIRKLADAGVCRFQPTPRRRNQS